MKEHHASRVILAFSLLVILIVGLSTARAMSQSPSTYDGTRTDVKALETDSSAYQTEDADGAAAVMVDENNEKTAASNVVYSVVFNYRGYDTLGESFILIGAIAGTTAILRKKKAAGQADEEKREGLHFADADAFDPANGVVADRVRKDVSETGKVVSPSGHRFKKKPVIVRCGADGLMPLALIYGWYIILHGAMSPGGGFQGGVLASSAVMLIYLAYGVPGVKKAFHTRFLHGSEMAAEIFYVIVALAGILAGTRFCYNFVFSASEESAMLMNDAVGYHVMAGISCLLILMVGTLDREDMKRDKTIKYHPASAGVRISSAKAAEVKQAESTASGDRSGEVQT